MSENAGFSTGKPWLPAHPNFKKRNVAAQQKDENSFLNFTKKLIALRKENQTLRSGDFLPLSDLPKDVMAYLRKSDDVTILVALNFSAKEQKLSLPQDSWAIFFSETRKDDTKGKEILLSPHEILLLKAK